MGRGTGTGWKCPQSRTSTTSDWQAFQGLRSRLGHADRLAILRIKNDVCRRPEYRKQVRSIDIYTAVLEQGVRTVEEFDRWALTSLLPSQPPNV